MFLRPRNAYKVDPDDVSQRAPPVTDAIFRSPKDFADCIEPSWRHLLNAEFTKPYFASLLSRLCFASNVLPRKEDVLAAFEYCPFDRVKVVIVGQEPYHTSCDAHGLAFGVHNGVPTPRSLANIYLELSEEYGGIFRVPGHGCLEKWAKQGVLLLNAALTVAEGVSGSHQKFGWKKFITAVIEVISSSHNNVVFLAWGKHAQKICRSAVDRSKHSLLVAGHPSPLSVKDFRGCGHFRETNRILTASGKTPINWNAING
jgi:uracil-DNA glycosylase